MSTSAIEISELIKKKIQQLDLDVEARTEGTVVSIADGVARVHGLSDAMQGEMLEFPDNTYGLALNLERDSVGAVILGDYENVSEGNTVKCTKRILEVPVGEALLGRVVDSLGNPVDGKGPIEATESSPIEKIAPRRDRPAVRRAAGADRPQVHRRHGAGRTRPARAHHR